jgi:hypothetical protein
VNYTTEYDYLVSKLDEQETVIAQHLINGKAAGIEEYKRLCGFVEGLRYAKEIIKDLQKRQENDADE